MRTFRATATNGKGLTFQFSFRSANWCGIEEAARRALDEIVAADPLHQRNGPWTARGIDVGA